MDRVEYEVDDADSAFIEKMREQFDLPATVLDEDKFEIILDRLEKKAFQRSNKRILDRDLGGPQANDDVPCAVCNDRDYEAKNLIVFCDGCSMSLFLAFAYCTLDVAVHQDCYGVKRIPDGAWYCSKCKADVKNVVRFACGRKPSCALPHRQQCELCPMETGAFKPTDHGTWCHLSCAIWMPGSRFAFLAVHLLYLRRSNRRS